MISRKTIDNQILKLALPAVVTNITVPLLGLCDTAISGHLGDSIYVAAIAAGSMMLNVLTWLCGFLRMGTSGLTAEAYGADDEKRQLTILYRSIALALAIGAATVIFHGYIRTMLINLISASTATSSLASEYFKISIWSIPPLLCILSINGWFIGMQTTTKPMVISISMNIINIAASLILVLFFKTGFQGVAWGTVIANWSTLAIASGIVIKFINSRNLKSKGISLFHTEGVTRFFKTNTDLFLRSACIMGVSLSFTSIGARMGDTILGANALLMQFFIIFSYITDAMAYAAEALTGRFAGAHDSKSLLLSVKRLLFWGMMTACIFTLIYIYGYDFLLRLMTDRSEIIKICKDLSIYVFLLPVCSIGAFLLDGIFIGFTATKRMLTTTFVATVIFILIIYTQINFTFSSESGLMKANGYMWIAFLSYLFSRSIGLAIQLPIVLKSNLRPHPTKITSH